MSDEVTRDDPYSFTVDVNLNITQQQQEEEKSKLPQVSIRSISMSGVLVVEFSEPFVKVEDLSVFKTSSLKVKVPMVEG